MPVREGESERMKGSRRWKTLLSRNGQRASDGYFNILKVI